TAKLLLPSGSSDRKHPARRMNSSVERQFADQHDVVDVPAVDHSGCSQYSERNRQVEERACLADVSWSKIDGDFARRVFESRVADRALDAIAAFSHRRIGQTNQRKAWKSHRDVDFDIDRTRFNPIHGCGPHARAHATSTAS